MVAVQINLVKAFDMIPHQVIREALCRKGFPEFVIRLVEDSYKDVDTTIKCSGFEHNIRLQRGVKQDDPLSPFLTQ